ncbi:EAL domain-containing protein [Cetobacterium somerae]|uniref:EAL domain-containing protein n=1 Tax=Cetobacterium somerae TaxID=188913 RepID=UPI00211E3799|nr:EAL domain-containing protein [Cetobacterium somerae]MCQ9626376.1 EAL domain-containing protein [Cetobacterium somerae]
MGSEQKYELDNILKKDLMGIIKIVFQPIYSLKENRTIAYEVLSRFYNDKIGEIPTLAAIEFLERSNCIHVLDFLVLERIEKYLLNKNVQICINISPATIVRDDFIEKLSVLKKGFKNLQIEITERGNFNYKNLTYKIIRLKELGVKVVMDDFPLGSSNLENLLKTHIDSVKIDKELIKYLKNNKGRSTYKSIVKFLKELECEIITEGIETLEELDFIKGIGVDLVQGYFIGKPISEVEFK